METRVKKSRLRQAQEVGTIGKNDRRGQRQLEEVRKPRALSPMWSHKGELRPPRLPEFRQDSGNDGKRRKGVSLQTVPGLEEGVRARLPPDRPRTGGRRPCPPTEGLGKAKNKSSSGDWRRSQTNLSAPAKDDIKTETRSC